MQQVRARETLKNCSTSFSICTRFPFDKSLKSFNVHRKLQKKIKTFQVKMGTSNELFIVKFPPSQQNKAKTDGQKNENI